MKKRQLKDLPKGKKGKYSISELVPVSGVYECAQCSNFQAFKKHEHFSKCDDCINNNRPDNYWNVTNEFTHFISKNIDIEFDKFASIQLKIADAITEYSGTLGFLILHIIWFSLWIFMNVGYFGPKYVFDPFPFGLLTMIVSLEAIFLSTFIMISQNVASKKSELRSEHEYQVNLETEKNVAEILAMMKDIRQEQELKDEKIEELKEAVEDISEEISEHLEQDIELSGEILDDLDSDIHEEIQDKIEEKLEEKIEEHEQESFEAQEQLLDEVGIDMIQESAPPVVLEGKKSRKKQRKNKRLKYKSELIKSFEDEFKSN